MRGIFCTISFLCLFAPGAALGQQCKTPADVKAVVDVGKTLLDQLNADGIKGTELCSTLQDAYRAQMEAVEQCAKEYKDAVTPKRPEVQFRVEYAAFGDIAHQNICDLTPAVWRGLKTCNENERAEARGRIGDIHFCVVKLEGSNADERIKKFCGGYDPSPFVPLEDKQYEVRFKCVEVPANAKRPDAKEPDETSYSLQTFRVPGQTDTIALGCKVTRHAGKITEIKPTVRRPGYPLGRYRSSAMEGTNREMGEAPDVWESPKQALAARGDVEPSVEVLRWLEATAGDEAVKPEAKKAAKAAEATAEPREKEKEKVVCTADNACSEKDCRALCTTICSRSAACRDNDKCKGTPNCEACFTKAAACSSWSYLQCRGYTEACGKCDTVTTDAKRCDEYVQCLGKGRCAAPKPRDYCAG